MQNGVNQIEPYVYVAFVDSEAIACKTSKHLLSKEDIKEWRAYLSSTRLIDISSVKTRLQETPYIMVTDWDTGKQKKVTKRYRKEDVKALFEKKN